MLGYINLPSNNWSCPLCCAPKMAGWFINYHAEMWTHVAFTVCVH